METHAIALAKPCVLFHCTIPDKSCYFCPYLRTNILLCELKSKCEFVANLKKEVVLKCKAVGLDVGFLNNNAWL